MSGALSFKMPCKESETQGEGHVKTEAEMGMMLSQAKKHQGLLTVTRSWERDLGWILSHSPQGEPALPMPRFRFKSPEL